MPVLLLLLFVVVPIAELYVIVQVAQGIGIGWTLLLLVADSILGTVLMRAQGRATWRRFRAATQAGRVPATEVIDGALVILGGAFLLAPGFITDVLGFLLLLPPTRAALRGVLVRTFASRLVSSLSPFGGGRRPGPGRREPHPDDPVDATAHDVPTRRLP
jgi:UPF0716 protein FxsA